MKQLIKEELEIQQGTSIRVDNGIFTITGPKGEVKKELHNPQIQSNVSSNTVTFEAKRGTQREKRLIKAYLAHIKSMIKGVNQGHAYKLKICSGHFPMTVSVKGNVFEIKNFIGESVPRAMQIPAGAKVTIDGQFVIVESISKEIAGRTAALIEILTRRAAFDKRRFQDGIFIIEKDGKPVV
jgi:large subunit ribosomal protein L6